MICPYYYFLFQAHFKFNSMLLFFSFSISAMYAEHELECQTLAFL